MEIYAKVSIRDKIDKFNGDRKSKKRRKAEATEEEFIELIEIKKKSNGSNFSA
jgi:hypothetical protein